MARKRDYKREYAQYHAHPQQKKERASRNAARALMIRKYGKAALDNQDVDHIDGNPRNNSPQNLQITTKKYNRSKQ
jgi:hypothetical protein